VNFASITLFVASQRTITKVSVYFAIDSVRERLNTPSHNTILQVSYTGVKFPILLRRKRKFRESQNKVIWKIFRCNRNEVSRQNKLLPNEDLRYMFLGLRELSEE
jgi:hypothetical protein